jgi:hypothetical protein
VGILLGNGDGTFQPVMTYSTGGYGASSVAVADLNGDGKPDIVVANGCADSSCLNFLGPVGVLLGNGDGTFQPAVTYSATAKPSSAYPVSLAVADLNGDGMPDVVVTNSCSPDDGCLQSSVGVLLGNGDGTFRPVMSFDTEAMMPRTVVVADWNGDGKPDVLVADYNSIEPPDPCQGIYPRGVVSFFINTTTVTTAAALVSSANPSIAGQRLTFTATITPPAQGPGTGTVTFLDGTTSLGSSTLARGGIATLSISTLTQGKHSITAGYTGNAIFQPSTSPVLSQVVRGATTTSLAASPDPSMSGESITLTATVTPQGSGTPTGTVKFLDGATNLGSAPLNSKAVAVLSVSTLTMGSHSLSATYGGDANFGSSASAVLDQNVEDFSITGSSSMSATVMPGQTANYTLTIAPGGGFNQSVSFTCSGAPSDSTCSVTPASVTLSGSKLVSVDVAVVTQGTAMGSTQPSGSPFGSGARAWAAWFGVTGIVLLGGGHRRRRTWHRQWLYGLAFVCLLALAIMPACGGGSSSASNSGSATPAGTYNLSVTGTFTTKLTLIVQ